LGEGWRSRVGACGAAAARQSPDFVSSAKRTRRAYGAPCLRTGDLSGLPAAASTASTAAGAAVTLPSFASFATLTSFAPAASARQLLDLILIAPHSFAIGFERFVVTLHRLAIARLLVDLQLFLQPPALGDIALHLLARLLQLRILLGLLASALAPALRSRRRGRLRRQADGACDQASECDTERTSHGSS